MKIRNKASNYFSAMFGTSLLRALLLAGEVEGDEQGHVRGVLQGEDLHARKAVRGVGRVADDIESRRTTHGSGSHSRSLSQRDFLGADA